MIKDWVKDIIHGVGGLNDFERYELACWPDERIAVAEWVIRCLANPKCKGSAEVLQAIVERRREQDDKEPS